MRSTSVLCVLLVDDFQPFRCFLRARLAATPGVQVVGEASDGLEAVQKAQDLQPDLILLDVGLPTINGIEAARRMLRHSPETKILFLSQERSSDVVEEALSTGAGGYVVKSEAATDLLPAVEAVLRGEQFVSTSLIGSISVRHEGNQIDRLQRKQLEHHEIKFHADRATLTDDFVQFTEATLISGSAVVIIASDSIRTSVFQRLSTDRVELDARTDRYLSIDISNPLSMFTLDEAVKAATQKGLHVAVG